MTAQELKQIHFRFFNSPAENSRPRVKKPSKSYGTVIHTGSTFIGNVRRTFKLGK